MLQPDCSRLFGEPKRVEDIEFVVVLFSFGAIGASRWPSFLLLFLDVVGELAQSLRGGVLAFLRAIDVGRLARRYKHVRIRLSAALAESAPVFEEPWWSIYPLNRNNALRKARKGIKVDQTISMRLFNR